MAAEIQFDATPGLTCYAQVRNSVGAIWNGAAFVAYATADVAGYDITATEQGTASGYYVASMPAVAAGIYNIVAKRQVGGAPAETDPTISTGSLDWAGSAVSFVGTPSIAASAVASVTGNVGGNVAGTVASVVGAVGSVTGNVGGNVTGSVGSVVGAVGSVTGLTASDVGAIKAKTDSLTFTIAGQIDANIQYVNDIQVDGVGTSADPWGPV